MLCYAMLCPATLCYVMICYAMLCYVSYVVLCYVMLLYVTAGYFYKDNLFKTFRCFSQSSYHTKGKLNLADYFVVPPVVA
jgi:hypothetical protein